MQTKRATLIISSMRQDECLFLFKSDKVFKLVLAFPMPGQDLTPSGVSSYTFHNSTFYRQFGPARHGTRSMFVSAAGVCKFIGAQSCLFVRVLFLLVCAFIADIKIQ